jgi:2,4-dienoyl-CoA reductase-like NADH-dependent reductase (Old Yellow Enzyme family)
LDVLLPRRAELSVTALQRALSPIAINRLTLKSRIVRAAHSTGYAPGEMTERLIHACDADFAVALRSCASSIVFQTLQVEDQ